MEELETSSLRKFLRAPAFGGRAANRVEDRRFSEPDHPSPTSGGSVRFSGGAAVDGPPRPSTARAAGPLERRPQIVRQLRARVDLLPRDRMHERESSGVQELPLEAVAAGHPVR